MEKKKWPRTIQKENDKIETVVLFYYLLLLNEDISVNIHEFLFQSGKRTWFKGEWRELSSLSFRNLIPDMGVVSTELYSP